MAEFVHSFFADRYILLKEEWLNTTLRFLRSKFPGSQNFSNVQLANLVFEQWKCSSFEKTSFATFSNHGIEPSTSKLELTSPVVCQIDSIIDVGTSYYSQMCRLQDKNIEDNTGFEKLFHEKEDDNDQKSSRLLKLTLSDGETTLNAIELSKCPQLSLYIKPGCKLLIYPPCTVRKGGTFLLKSTNCQILGGEVLPLLNTHRPLDRYMRLIGIKEAPKCHVTTPKPPVNRPIVKPATSYDDDYFPDYDDFEMQEFIENAPPATNPFVTVSSLSSRLPTESAIYTSPVRKKLKQSTLENVMIQPKPVGMLTSQKNDIKNDKLENMIEQDEEPISIPTPIAKVKVNPFIRTVPKPISEPKPQVIPRITPKIIKKEVEDDDDIEIIEIDSPTKSNDKKLSAEENMALKNFKKLDKSTIEVCQRKMKFCIGSRRFWVICIVDDVVEPLRVVDNLWTMKLSLKDVSGQVDCFLDNATLEGLIGYTCQEAIEIRKSSDMERRKDGKRRLEALQNQVQRLDLIFEIEFFASNTSIPVVRKMKTIAEQLDAY